MTLLQSNDFAISDLISEKVAPGDVVRIRGWLRSRRDSKAGLSFLVVYDGSCFDTIQVVASKDLPNYDQDVLKLTTGCSVMVEGKLVESPAKGQSVEIHASAITVVGWVDDPDTYPISPKRHTLEYLREHAHLRARTNTLGAVMRVQNSVAQAVHRFFDQNGFCWVHAPIITSNDSEGAGEMFRVSTLDLMNLPRTEKGEVDFSKDFFSRETFLTVSGQLAVEAYAEAISKVYSFGPTFRAENSNTPRHLAEFWMIEPEIAFADLEDDAALAERLLKFVFKAVLEERPDDMNFFVKWIEPTCVLRLEKLITSPFVYMEYGDAVSALEKENHRFEFKAHWGTDLQTEHERFLTEVVAEGRPVVVMNYPKDIKAFYMRLNDDQKTVAAMDILAPGIGEIAGGSQREERLDFLDKRMDELKLDKNAYWWYRDLRRYGTVPHSGFGIGFERLVCYITGMSNLRDIIPFPRVRRQADF